MGVGEGLAANQSGSPPAILPRSPDSRVRLGYIGIPRDPAHASNCSPSGSYDRDSSVQTQFGKSGCPSRGKSRRITVYHAWISWWPDIAQSSDRAVVLTPGELEWAPILR